MRGLRSRAEAAVNDLPSGASRGRYGLGLGRVVGGVAPRPGRAGRPRAVWHGRGRGRTTPSPSSNWWIKTARCEDNEVEATTTARLKSMPTSPLNTVIQHL